MKENILIIFPKGTFGDKNNNVQLFNSDKEKHMNMMAITRGIGQFGDYPEFKSLNLFIQGNQPNWTMIESWSDNDELFIKFVELLSEKLELNIDFC